MAAGAMFGGLGPSPNLLQKIGLIAKSMGQGMNAMQPGQGSMGMANKISQINPRAASPMMPELPGAAMENAQGVPMMQENVGLIPQYGGLLEMLRQRLNRQPVQNRMAAGQPDMRSERGRMMPRGKY